MDVKHVRVILVLAGLIVFQAGCNSQRIASPTATPYYFLKTDSELSSYFNRAYNQQVQNSYVVTSFITNPEYHDLEINRSGVYPIAGGEGAKPVSMGVGVYPFAIHSKNEKKTKFSGAFMVFNVDETIELATFGKSEETLMFKPEHLKDVQDGTLVTFTQTLDKDPVFVYWLGNRGELYSGGRPTVELDFSGISGVLELKLDGRKVENNKAILDVFEPVSWREYERYSLLTNIQDVTLVPQKHEFELHMNKGTRYRGYIRDLKANAFTAFMKIPCNIPEKLLEAAAKGTISTYTVYAQSGKDEGSKEAIAEIIFGMDTK